MIDIIIFKEGDTVTGVRSKGHSGYAASGHDIICSAVSILMINTVNALESFTEDRFTYILNEKEALLDIQLDDIRSDGAVLLMKTLALGLSMAAEDNARFVKIEYKEV